jgi:hypothetical protein
MRYIMFIVKFIFLAAFFIISNNNLQMIDAENRQIFIDEYKSWVKEVSTNIGSLTGYVVDVEWLPEDHKSNEEQINIGKHTTIIKT